jgi:hypothetical protein
MPFVGPKLTMTTPVAKVGSFERALAREWQAAQLRALHRVGRQATQMLGQASRGVKDLGSYGAGWRYRAAFNRLEVFNAAPHAFWVEHGRRPGQRPPPARALYGWAERHLGDWKLAYPLAKSIGRKGIKARPLLETPRMQNAINQVFGAAMVGAMTDVARRAGAK